jgi:hypothetical protein
MIKGENSKAPSADSPAPFILKSRIATEIIPRMLVTGTPTKYVCFISFFLILITSFMVAHPAIENPPINRRKYRVNSIEPEKDITADMALTIIKAIMMFLEFLFIFLSHNGCRLTHGALAEMGIAEGWVSAY